MQNSIEGDEENVRLRYDLLVPDPNNPAKRWIEVISWKPRIFLYHNILTKEECDHIIRIGMHFINAPQQFLSLLVSFLHNPAEPKVSRSSVVGADGKPVVNEARTSSGYFIVGEDAKDPVIRVLCRSVSLFHIR